MILTLDISHSVGRAGVSRLPWTPAKHASMAEGLLVLSDYSQTVNVSVWAFFLCKRVCMSLLRTAGMLSILCSRFSYDLLEL